MSLVAVLSHDTPPRTGCSSVPGPRYEARKLVTGPGHQLANPGGQFRKVIEIDQGGTKITKWIGQRSFVDEFTRPGRRVTSFRTDPGYVDASGRPLR